MKKELSKELDLDLDIVAGKLVLILTQEGTDGGAEMKVWANSDRLLDKLAEKLGGGDIVKRAIGLLKGALKAV